MMMTGAPLALLAVLGPRYGGELTVGAPRAAADRLVRSLVDETLLRIAADGTLTAGLAELTPRAADAEAPVLTLREGVSFHDGRPVRAADAVASLQGFLRSSSLAAQTLSRAVVGIEALDDRRLVLRLDGPRPAALFALAAPAAALSGTGAFVPTLAVAGRRASVRAFAGHLRGRPYLDTVTVVTLPGEGDGARALRDGRVDAALGAPGVSTPAAMLVLVLDPSRPPFDAPALRAAVDATVGRAGLARLLATDARPPTLLLMEAAQSPSPTPDLGHGTAVTLGVEEGVPPLASQRVVATLSALGLRVTAAARGAAELRAASDPARLLLFLPEVNEPVLVLRELRSLVPGRSRADEVLDAAEREVAGEPRRALLARAEAALREEHACLALIRWPVSFGAAAAIHGVRLEPDGRLVLEDAWREAGS